MVSTDRFQTMEMTHMKGYNEQCIVEFQAFKNNKKGFIIKELIILDVLTGVYSYFVFKPPYDFSMLLPKYGKTNNWLTRFYHHIRWNEGFTSYSELNAIMSHFCEKYKTIYTTGKEKCKWLQQFSSGVIIDCSIPKINHNHNLGLCIGVKNRRHKYSNCALSKAFQLYSNLFNKTVHLQNLVSKNNNDTSTTAYRKDNNIGEGVDGYKLS